MEGPHRALIADVDDINLEKNKENITSLEDKTSRVCFITLGCKVNQTESEALSQLFIQKGYHAVKESEDPGIIVINTCTVTGTGSIKSRKLIRKMVKDHPFSTIAVIGCYSQIRPEEVAEIKGVDLIMGTQDRISLIDQISKIMKQKTMVNCQDSSKEPIRIVKDFNGETVFEELPLIENESRTRAMLKIQDGCNQFCTYCIVPYARGPSRSRNPDNVLREAQKLLMAGYKEIVLTGVHIGAYGKDFSEREFDLADLVSKIAELNGIQRLRLGSIEPMEFTEKLLEVVMAYSTICPHFHIPLQSGSDTVLKKMKRPYRTEDYIALIRRIRGKMPLAAIAADIMTGFPGESDQQHQEALDFIEKCEFAGIHVFPYSRRPGTPAAEMPDQVPRIIKAARVREIIEVGRKSRKRYAKQFFGKSLDVLLEKVEVDGTARGHTDNYLELQLPAELNPGNWKVGELVKCLVKKEYFMLSSGLEMP